jgi:hypothetical protein
MSVEGRKRGERSRSVENSRPVVFCGGVFSVLTIYGKFIYGDPRAAPLLFC